MTFRDPAAKVPGWLRHADWFDFKASPAFGAGDAKIRVLVILDPPAQPVLRLEFAANLFLSN